MPCPFLSWDTALSKPESPSTEGLENMSPHWEDGQWGSVTAFHPTLQNTKTVRAQLGSLLNGHSHPPAGIGDISTFHRGLLGSPECNSRDSGLIQGMPEKSHTLPSPGGHHWLPSAPSSTLWEPLPGATASAVSLSLQRGGRWEMRGGRWEFLPSPTSRQQHGPYPSSSESLSQVCCFTPPSDPEETTAHS